jgi:hypothetical protein
MSIWLSWKNKHQTILSSNTQHLCVVIDPRKPKSNNICSSSVVWYFSVISRLYRIISYLLLFNSSPSRTGIHSSTPIYKCCHVQDFDFICYKWQNILCRVHFFAS